MSSSTEKTQRFALYVPISIRNPVKREAEDILVNDSQEKEERNNKSEAWFHQYFIPPTFNTNHSNASNRLKAKNELYHQFFDTHYNTKQVFSLTLPERLLYKSLHQQPSTASESNNLDSGRYLPPTSLGALTYGELVDIYPLYTIFFLLQKNHRLPAPGTGLFYDLGAGSGRVIVAAYLLYPFAHYIGIEILSSLVDISQQIHQSFIKYLQSASSDSSLAHSYSQSLTAFDFDHYDCRQNPYQNQRPPIQFLHGSIDLITCDRKEEKEEIILDPRLDWRQGDIIFINSTCFDKDLMNHLSYLCTGLKSGSIVITLTHMLSKESDCDCVHELRLEMSW